MFIFSQIVCVVFLFFLLFPKSDTRQIVENHMLHSPGSVPIFFVICLAFCIGLNPNVYRWFGNEDIDTMPVGEYCYYVEIGRYEDTESRVYTLPAKIEVYRGEYGKSYRLHTVYFSNGGYLDADGERLYLDEGIGFTDQNGEYWVGEFTNERCAPSPFVESNDTPALYTVLITFDVLVLVLSYISLQFSVQKTIKEDKQREALPDCDLFYALGGEYYHSSRECTKIKNNDTIYEAAAYINEEALFKRKPCPKCCRVIDGKVYPEDSTP